MKKHITLLMAIVAACALGTPAAAESHERRLGSETDTSISAEKQPTATQRPVRPAPTGAHSLPGPPNKVPAGCCSSPTPFPGLDCCDTRDCGWFACDDEVTKSFR